MDCSMPGFSVHHQILEFVQTHVHPVGDAIQLSHPLLSPSPLPSNFSSIRVFCNESVLRIRWPKYWSFSFSINPSNEYSGLISFGLTGLLSLQSKGFSRVCPNSTVQKHQFFGAQLSVVKSSTTELYPHSAQLSLWSNSYIHTWLLEKSNHSFDFWPLLHRQSNVSAF